MNKKEINEDYFVRYGNQIPNRSYYVSLVEAEKIYNKIKLDEKITWKELIHEPIEEDDTQYIIKQDEVKVLDLGICKFILPKN